MQNPLKVAARSPCRYKVAAIGYDVRGKVLGFAFNLPRLNKKGGGIHAEIALLRKYGPRLHSIHVVRATKTGLPSRIDICPSCRRILEKNGVKLISSA